MTFAPPRWGWLCLPHRYQAWVDHLNSVIEVSPLGARLDVPLLRRAVVDADQRAPLQQQKQQAATGAGLVRLLVSVSESVSVAQKQKQDILFSCKAFANSVSVSIVCRATHEHPSTGDKGHQASGQPSAAAAGGGKGGAGALTAAAGGGAGRPGHLQNQVPRCGAKWTYNTSKFTFHKCEILSKWQCAWARATRKFR